MSRITDSSNGRVSNLSINNNLNISNPSVNEGFEPSVAVAVPEGDRWLCEMTNEDANNGNYLIIPNTIILNQTEGFIRFFLNIKLENKFNHIYNNFMIYDVDSNTDGSSYLYIYLKNNFTNMIGIDYRTISGDDKTVFFEKSDLICNGETHEIIFSYNDRGIKVYVDNELDLGATNIDILKTVSSGDNFDSKIGGSLNSADNFQQDKILIDDVVFSEEAYDPEETDMDEYNLIARYQGNTELGQLANSVGGGDSLNYNNNNPVANTSSYPIYLNPPNGDKWLGHFDNTISYSNPYEYFVMPIESRPHNAGGSVSFYMKCNKFEGGTIYSFVTDDRNFEIGIGKTHDNGNNQIIGKLSVYYYDGSEVFQYILNANVTDNRIHKIKISWDGSNVFAYVDDSEVFMYDNSGNSINSPSFDFGSSININNLSIGYFGPTIIEDAELFIDDVQVRDENNTLIARWAGSSVSGQLRDASGNDNNLSINASITSPASPSPVEGDRWLGSWNSSTSNDACFYPPYTIVPHYDGGSIEFDINSNSAPTSFNIFKFSTYNLNNEEQLFELKFQDIGDGIKLYIGWNGEDTMYHLIYFATSVTDNSNHTIKLEWNQVSGTMLGYVDGVLDTASSGTSFSFDFFPAVDFNEFAIGQSFSGSDAMYIDNFKVSDENDVLICQYKGNANHWLRDETGNNADLRVGGPNIDFQPAKGLASIPEGDKWLGRWKLKDYADDGGNGINYFNMPLSSRPHNEGGSISFYFNNSGDRIDTDIFAFETWDGSDSETDRYFYLYTDSRNSPMIIEWTDNEGNDLYYTITDKDIFDGETHLIEVIWDATSVTVKVDDEICLAVVDTNIDFGRGIYASECSINANFSSATNSKFDVFIDDMTIKDENGDIIARWKGNSGINGQLNDEVIEAGNHDLNVKGRVDNFPNTILESKHHPSVPLNIQII